MNEDPRRLQSATASPPPPADATSRIVDVTDTKRRRRPTGDPVPLPKQIGLTGKLWLTAAFVLAVLGCIFASRIRTRAGA